MSTKKDDANALFYADRMIWREKLEYYKHVDLFKSIQIDDAGWPNGFYLPVGLASSKNVYAHYPTRESCEEITCYPFSRENVKCRQDDELTEIDTGQQLFTGCQKHCFSLRPKENEPSMFETAWYEGKCIISNTELKQWSISPVTRSSELEPGYTNVAAFLWDDSTQKCFLNEAYCAYFELGFDKDKRDCIEPTDVRLVFEEVFGKVISRGAIHLWKKHVGDNEEMQADAPIDVAHDVDHLKRTMGLYFSEFAFDFVADNRTDIIKGAEHYAKVMTKKFNGWMGNKLPNNKLMRVTILKTIRAGIFSSRLLTMMIKPLKYILRGLNGANSLYTIFTIVGAVADIIDKPGYKHYLNESTLAHVQDRLWYNYRMTHKGNGNVPFELNPEILIMIMELTDDDENDEVTVFETQAIRAKYLEMFYTNLTVNSAGQNINWQKKVSKLDFDDLFEPHVDINDNAIIIPALLSISIAIVLAFLNVHYVLIFIVIVIWTSTIFTLIHYDNANRSYTFTRYSMR